MRRYLDDVSVVELVLQGDDLPHEAQGTQLVVTRSLIEERLLILTPAKGLISYLQEGVSRLDQDQDSPQQVLCIFESRLWQY